MKYNKGNTKYIECKILLDPSLLLVYSNCLGLLKSTYWCTVHWCTQVFQVKSKGNFQKTEFMNVEL